MIPIVRPAALLLLALASCSPAGETSSSDWLVHPPATPAAIRYDAAAHELTLDNGLVRRTLRLAPNAATVGFDNLVTGAAMLRAVRPEARVQLDGIWYDVGGLTGQPNHAYLTEAWIDALEADPAAFRFAGYREGPLRPHLDWKNRRYAGNSVWPPPGVEVALRFDAPGDLGVEVDVHYALHRSMPVMAKWLTVRNRSARTVRLDRFVSEVLAVVEAESSVETRERWMLPAMHVQSDYSFHGMDAASSNATIHWMPDSLYETQVSYLKTTPALLESRPPIGPGIDLGPGDSLVTYRTYELLYDSDDRERRGLAVRRMYRTIAPWITENPIFMHVRESDSASIRRAVDQAAEVGFEMVIITFGSGFDMENEDPAYIERIRDDVAYAHGKGIELGGYSLLSSRRIDDETDVIDPATGRPGGAQFGNAPCLTSRWGEAYFAKLERFLDATGMDVLEHDGSYPGDVCASTTHPGHRGLADSQWRQWERITRFYARALANGVYLNVPDLYVLNGSTKIAMGYRETNWSLPRAQQIIHGRQNIYDGTWEKTPSMGWMFVPLVEYHGGGEAATLEPLSDHLDAYEAHLANLFGNGVMAAYRGPRLYDTDETKAVVKRWVDFYKRYRATLDGDIIHLRRADGRRWDGLLHVNPEADVKGLAMIYNPTDSELRETIRLPLYYTGLTDRAQVRVGDGPAARMGLDRGYYIEVEVAVPANGWQWVEISD
ncbi:MAG: hypothetical protein R2834_15055 [Rhodothermales bacterium]